MKDCSGNILFVILIAVALFAALSYAVTQSSRSGGSDTTRETSTINAGVLSQYTSSLRASLQRMQTDNHTVLDFQFNPPTDFASLTSTSVGVFHSQGGGVIYQMAPSNLIDENADNPTGLWVYSLNFEVKNVGTSSAGSLDGNDLIAFLVGVKKDVCSQVNKGLGISHQPMPYIDSQTFSSELFYQFQDVYVDNDYVLLTSEYILGNDTDSDALSGKAEGCYWEDEGRNYVYYNVLSER